jgi:P-type conjugative transfer protein TrbJ
LRSLQNVQNRQAWAGAKGEEPRGSGSKGIRKSRSQTWRSRYSSLQAIDRSISHTQQLLNQSQRLTRDINRIDQAFRRSYPKSYPVSTSSKQLIGDAQKRWQNSLAACQDALPVETGVVQALETSRTETNGLVSSSQSAVGILQASQAGNQLIALRRRPTDGHDHPA